jgi:hypothetical protein
MLRFVAIGLAGLLAISAASAQPAAGNAWLIFVDELHVEFAQTGRLRTLLRTIANELIEDGDGYMFRASGPSATASKAPAFTIDRKLADATIRMMSGNALKPGDLLGTAPGGGIDEVLYRARVALANAEEAIGAVPADGAARKAMLYVSNGYDLDMHPETADRVRDVTQRARDAGITIFAINSRSFGSLLQTDPLVDAAAWQRHQQAARRSLTTMAEITGGFVVEKANEPHAELKRISQQMR